MSRAHAAVAAGPVEAGWRGAEIVAVLSAIVGLGAALWLIVAGDGWYHDDDLTHYLIARRGWSDAASAWDAWGRPGWTVPMVPVARWFGLSGCRVWSALETALAAYVAFRIARRMGPAEPGRGAWVVGLAPLLVWLGPLTLQLSATTLTETAGALYLAAAVWLLLRGDIVWACGALGLLYVTRYETVALGLAVGGALFVGTWREARFDVRCALASVRLWQAAAAMLLPVAIWAVVAWFFDLPASASPLHILANMDRRDYGSGAWWWYLPRWIEAAGCGPLALAVCGAIVVGRAGAWPVGVALFYVAVHAALYRFNFAQSGGYARFLVVAGPLVGALGAHGLSALWRGERRMCTACALAICGFGLVALHRSLPESFPWVRQEKLGVALAALGLGAAFAGGWVRRPAALGALALAVAACVWQPSRQVRPMRLRDYPYGRLIAEARDAIAGGGGASIVWVTHPIAEHLVRGAAMTHVGSDSLRRWFDAPAGAVFVWDNKYGDDLGGTPPGDQPLHAALVRLGRRLYAGEERRGAGYPEGRTVVEVYRREAGPGGE